ncbi:Uncharacterised protein [Mycobacteroides abscessus subsp. abscessus]|nr:Uncharacterised protein [Mycobacteroides abscessus subsp. abscessus]
MGSHVRNSDPWSTELATTVPAAPAMAAPNAHFVRRLTMMTPLDWCGQPSGMPPRHR